MLGAQELRTEAHPRLPGKICHHIYSETTELVKTGRPRARNDENKRAKIQKKLIFRSYPRHTQTEDRPAQRTPLLTQEICIPWVLTLRAAPPHSNDTVSPKGAISRESRPPRSARAATEARAESDSAISVLPLPSRTPCPPPAPPPRWPAASVMDKLRPRPRLFCS